MKMQRKCEKRSQEKMWGHAKKWELSPTVVLIRDQTRSVAKQVSVAVGWVKIEISLMAQLKGLTAKFKLM